MELSKKEFLSLTEDQVRDWYGQNKEVLETIEWVLDEDLNGFRKESGLNRLAFFRIRVKEFNSLWNKVQKYQMKEKLDETLNAKKIKGKIRIQDVVDDLIGARLVFYFEPDLQWALKYFFTWAYNVEQVEIYEFNTDSPSSIAQGLKDMASYFYKDTESKQKQSGYESVHLTIRYRPEMKVGELRKFESLSRKDHKERPRLSEEKIHLLKDFPIEMQVRTVLQHAWAQVEHRLNYNLQKRNQDRKILSNVDPLIQDDFRAYKHLLKAGEEQQNIIWQRHWDRSTEEHLSKESAESGDQFQFFENDIQSKLQDIHDALFDERKRKTQQNIFKEFLKLVNKLTKKYHLDFYSAEVPDLSEEWGRKRAIHLLLGFFAIVGDDSVQDMVNTIFKEKKILSNRTPDLIVNVTSLYEQIKTGDRHFRYIDVDRQDYRFCDPLVHYRAAGLHYVGGSPRRAIGLMEDALHDRETLCIELPEQARLSSSVTNGMHILRRCAEYYWTAYNQDDRTSRDDLEEAYQYIILAGESDDGPLDKERNKIEKRKILSHRVTFLFYKHVLDAPRQSVDDFRQELQNLKSSVHRLLNEEILLQKDAGVIGLQALALYLAYKDEATLGDNTDVTIKTLLDEARIRVSQDSRASFHRRVVDEISAAIYGLLSHEG